MGNSCIPGKKCLLVQLKTTTIGRSPHSEGLTRRLSMLTYEQSMSPRQHSSVLSNPLTRQLSRVPEGVIELPEATWVPIWPGCQKEAKYLSTVFSKHFILRNLNEDDISGILPHVQLYAVKPHQVVYEQGTPAWSLFILKEGKAIATTQSGETAQVSRGLVFGDQALSSIGMREATVKTLAQSLVYRLERSHLHAALEEVYTRKSLEYKKCLASAPVLSLLKEDQFDLLQDLVKLVTFKHGHHIIDEGTTASQIYIIKEGEVKCFAHGKEVRRLGPGEVFGEQAMLNDSLRTATVVAVNKVSLLSISLPAVTQVLGSQLLTVVYHNAVKIALDRSAVLFTQCQASLMADHMTMTSYSEDSVVISEGTLKAQGLWFLFRGELSTSGQACVRSPSVIGAPEAILGSSERHSSDWVAQTEAVVGFISKSQAERVLGRSLEAITSLNQRVKMLQSVKLLQTLSRSTLEKVARQLRLKTYFHNQVILNAGDRSQAFFVIQSGQVVVWKDEKVIRTLEAPNYFGERGILLRETRTATVVAAGDVKCWVCDDQAFVDILDEPMKLQLVQRMLLEDDSIELAKLHPVRHLGSGSFGHVVLAVHQDTEALYAVKAVPRWKIAQNDVYENLVYERRILTQLDHPMIVKLVKTFKDDTRVYFLQEFVEGTDLFEVLRRHSRFNENQAKFYAACLVLILEYLHMKKVIYRDMKPENIIVDEAGYPKLIDFGASKQISGRTFTAIGTPYYMSPEVIRGTGYSFAADLWTLGVNCYELLTGQLPFGQCLTDPVQVYEAILYDTLKFPPCLDSLATQQLLLQLLQKDSTARGPLSQLKNAAFFSNVCWESLLEKRVKAPFPNGFAYLKQDVQRALAVKESLLLKLERIEARDKLKSEENFFPTNPNWDKEF